MTRHRSGCWTQDPARSNIHFFTDQRWVHWPYVLIEVGGTFFQERRPPEVPTRVGGTGLTKVTIRMKGRKLDLSFAPRSAGSSPARDKALVMH